MAYILLVRHGQNDWVSKNRLAGWTPGVHLNEIGRKQAHQAAARLADLPLKAVVSSPVTRCVETATIIAAAHSLSVVMENDLGEVRYGKWEGKKIAALAKRREWYAVQHFPSRFRFPKGESLYEVQGRAVAALERLNAAYQPHEMIVACSHADVIKLVLAHYLGVHIDLFQRINIGTASVSAVALHPGGPVRVERINDTGPMTAPRPPEKKKAKQKRQERKDDGDGAAKKTPRKAREQAPSNGRST